MCYPYVMMNVEMGGMGKGGYFVCYEPINNASLFQSVCSFFIFAKIKVCHSERKCIVPFVTCYFGLLYLL